MPPESPSNPIPIAADSKDLKGRYSNFFIVTSQEREVVIDFLNKVQIGNEAQMNLVSRVFLNRFTAQELITVLQKSMQEWEKIRYEAPYGEKPVNSE